MPPNNELMPCPFCGSKPQWGLTKKRGCQMHGDPIQYVTLSCTKCDFKPGLIGGCRYRGGDEPKYEKEARQEAAEKWNTRAPIPAPTPSAEAVRGAKLDEMKSILTNAIINAQKNYGAEAAFHDSSCQAIQQAIHIVNELRAIPAQGGGDAAKALEDMPHPFDNINETVGDFRQKALKWLGDNYLTIHAALQQRVREG